MNQRYALYYAPRAEDGLAEAASQWLGWNPETGRARAVPRVSGIDAERLAEITAEPRLYGFHGTLKAPMALADEVSERELLDAVGRFAATRRAFAVPAMYWLAVGILALVPAARASFRTWPTTVSSSTASADRPTMPN